jgi:hypothetical protein
MSTFVMESSLAPEEKARVVSRFRQIIWLGSAGGKQMFRAPNWKQAVEMAKTLGPERIIIYKAPGAGELPETD